MVKIINYCWACNKEHDMSKTSVMQDFKCGCGGYVLTPSGKGLFKVIEGDNK